MQPLNARQWGARSREEFFNAVRDAPEAALLLDYDGTLAPFRAARDQALPYPGVAEQLNRIMAAGRSRVVMISGRPVADLLPLMKLNATPEVWGAHGWERLREGAREVERGDLPAAARRALARALAWADEMELGARCEMKTGCCALHFRGLPRRKIDELDRRASEHWRSLAQEGGLVLSRFDGGIELHVPGRGKGHAVRAVLSECDRAAAVAYLGDDQTDEDAFAALQSRGLRVLVRAEARETKADVWLKPPEQLISFLENWAEARASPTGGR